jgi:hypothetical protein
MSSAERSAGAFGDALLGDHGQFVAALGGNPGVERASPRPHAALIVLAESESHRECLSFVTIRISVRPENSDGTAPR